MPNGGGPLSHFHRNFFNTTLPFGFLAGVIFPKPDDGLLELVESAHLPAVQAAQEREQPGAMMRIGRIEHSQAMVFSESYFVKGAYKPGKILDGEHWLGAYMKCPHIKQSALQAALSASPRNFS